MTIVAAPPGKTVELRTETKAEKGGAGGIAVATHVVLIIWALVTAIPVLWVLMSSLKTDNEIFVDSWRPPASLQFEQLRPGLDRVAVLLLLPQLLHRGHRVDADRHGARAR